MEIYRAGIDVGSTTVKLVLLDSAGTMVYGEYRRHRARIQETLADMLREAMDRLGSCLLSSTATGSGAMGLSRALDIGFEQEVVAVAAALKQAAPQTDVAVELGGEDAKIIYFTDGLEERMNGVCAGGTGSFIDQMAALLQMDAAGLDRAAADYREIYPIAARCGVFAKSDIQPLINEGATTADLAASIFQAVVNQTISGLACGKPLRGHIAFLGGPLHFLPQLRAAFIRTLHLTEETAIVPENSHLFAALGAALSPEKPAAPRQIEELVEALQRGVSLQFELKRLPPLFPDTAAYEEFRRRHARARVQRAPLEEAAGDCFLGIDAGSTTTKLALIDGEGRLLWSFYAGNEGSPIKTALRAMAELGSRLPAGARIARSCSTGYGEALLQSAFRMEEGEVETIAHVTGAAFFDPEVDCVLDIGGQDMKCIRLKKGAVDSVMLNEACSSGCGSFLENFASSMGYTAEAFAAEALFAPHPVDLGTRCTVFMNSNVKQAQKEGASIRDISAGLAFSVVKNALFKVIKLTDAAQLGRHLVVQGGTFHNQAVLRALEQLSGVEAVRPDIAGIMGAFGAALIACSRYHGQAPTLLGMEELQALTWETSITHCGGCENRCMLTISRFPGGRRHITGNRCEKGLGHASTGEQAPNLSAYKLRRLFAYEPLDPATAPMGEIGIPRVLNLWENYPFWFTFLTLLGFSVRVSPLSSRALYALGMESIPSESECYPAKLAHGHVQWLIDQGVQTIFHPSVFYERAETPGAQNHFNCPMVCAYPENLKNNVDDITRGRVRFIRPFIALTDEETAARRLVRVCREEWGITDEKKVRMAVRLAWMELKQVRADIRAEGQKALRWMAEHHRSGIVLAGRPYHTDPEINHGIPQLIAGYGLAVLTEDSIPADFTPVRPLRVRDQWTYHSRLYTAAQFVAGRTDLELVQLNSFGCGLDAVTTDQVGDILEAAGKLYTVLKIDEVNNLGAARIRLRSLLAAMRLRQEQGLAPCAQAEPYRRVQFTKAMRKAGWTILAPRMSPFHFDLLAPVFRRRGYHLVMLENDSRSAVDMGLKFVNNDACYPSIISIGQMMDAVLSGQYDVDRLALIMSQTGGCCRASNYVGFIRRALEKAGLPNIPVISLNFIGEERNPGFTLSPAMVIDAGKALVLGDLLMRCLYRTRPYEAEKGSADALHRRWRETICRVLGGEERYGFGALCRDLVRDFDRLPLQEGLRKPRVGIVGEILVKYMPFANNHLAELLEAEGAEPVVPDLMDFVYYTMFNGIYKADFLGKGPRGRFTGTWGIRVVRQFQKAARDALAASRRFEPPVPIGRVAELARPILSLGNQYGEGWFLCGEMAELLESGCPNIVCIQPFGCLPNHVVGKGVIKQLRRRYPQANIAAVDYDPGASEVNQLNRIKLMLSQAKARLAEEPSRPGPA